MVCIMDARFVGVLWSLLRAGNPARINPSATKMTGRPGHWTEPGEYNILFLGSMLVISSQDSPDLGIENSHANFLDWFA